MEVECIDRMYLNVYVPQAAVRRRGGVVSCSGSRGCRSPRRRCWSRSAEAFVAGGAPVRPRPGRAVGRLRQGATQGRRGARVPGRVRRRRGGAVHRPGAGEDRRVPHREAAQPGDRGDLSVDRALHGDGQPLLLLLRRRATSGRSSSSSPATSPTTPSCASTATSGPSARPPRPASGSRRWTTGSPPATTRQRLQRDLRPARTQRRSTRLLRKWLARLPHPFTAADRRAGYRYEHLDPAGRVLPHPDARPAAVGPGVLRGGHPREPRHRPARPGASDLRPAAASAVAAAPHRAGSAPG